MESTFKAGVVVAILLAIAFAFTKRRALEFMTPAAWSLRVRTYVVVALSAFFLPSFWLFAAATLVIVTYAASKESNRAALYLLILFAAPPYSVEIPVSLLGIGRIFDVNHYRVATIAVLLGMTIFSTQRKRSSKLQRKEASSSWLVADASLVGFIALNTILYFPLDSMTGVLRRLLLNILDIALPYYLMRSQLQDKQRITEALACLALGGLVLIPAAVMETLKYWALYFSVIPVWGIPEMSYLARDGLLRAVTTGGHSIPFGYFMGCTMILSAGMLLREGMKGHGAGLMLAAIACVASFSRGPWVSTGVGLAVFYILAGKDYVNPGKTALLAVCGLIVLVATPYGDRVLDYIPFVGSVEEGNIDYRIQLARTSWLIIQQNILFGNPFFLQHMEHLRQGQGIIDLVNTYAGTALSTGLVGAGLFTLVFFCGVIYPLLTLERSKGRRKEPKYQRGVAAGLAALSLSSMVVIATCSMIGVLNILPWCLAGLSSSYLLAHRRERAEKVADAENIGPSKNMYSAHSTPTWAR